MKQLNKMIAPIAGVTIAVFGVNAQPAQGLAKQDTLFGDGITTNVVLDFSKATDGTLLDANALDSSGGQQIDIDGTSGTETVSTTNGNVGDIYQQAGLTITGVGEAGDTVGLFNSNCVPAGGSSEFGDSANLPSNSPLLCGDGGANGDNDLATGADGSYDNGNITYDTEPQGNLVIVEENPGNGQPDDFGGGGSITLTFEDNGPNDFIAARIKEITFVDDSSGNFIFNFRDPNVSPETISFNAPDQNDLTTEDDILGSFSQASQEELLESVVVDFSASGGISTIVFAEYQRVPFETETTLGLLLVGSYGLFRFYKRKQAAQQADAEE